MNEPPIYENGDIVWVKLGSNWWPGEVVDFELLSTEIKEAFKKPPLVSVSFFQEDSYEFIKNLSHICKYNCAKKDDFIKKGMDAPIFNKKVWNLTITEVSWFADQFRNKNTFMEKFPADVCTAEKKTNGNVNILADPKYGPEKKKENFAALIFGTPSPKRSHHKDTPRSHGRSSQKSSRYITHPRFIGGNYDHQVRVMVQNSDPDSDTEVVPVKTYTCSTCGFTSTRIDVIVVHNKTHMQGIYNSGSSSKPFKRTQKKVLRMSTSKTNSIDEDLALLAQGLPITDGEETDEEIIDVKPRKKPKVIKEVKEIKQKKKPAKGVKLSPKPAKIVDVKEVKTDIRVDLLAEWDDNEDELDDISMNISEAEKKKDSANKEPDKSCFDFSEDEDNPILSASPGRKIPRVLPDKTKSTESETDAKVDHIEVSEVKIDDTICIPNKIVDRDNKELKDKAELEVDKSVLEAKKYIDDNLVKDKVVVEMKKVNKGIDTKKTSSAKDAHVAKEKSETPTKPDDLDIQSILEATSVPKLPEIPQLLKCEQNFHNARTIKFPDKDTPINKTLQTSEVVATKLTNPKKRFVKSFEDFELSLREKSKLDATSASKEYEDFSISEPAEHKEVAAISSSKVILPVVEEIKLTESIVETVKLVEPVVVEAKLIEQIVEDLGLVEPIVKEIKSVDPIVEETKLAKPLIKEIQVEQIKDNKLVEQIVEEVEVEVTVDEIKTEERKTRRSTRGKLPEDPKTAEKEDKLKIKVPETTQKGENVPFKNKKQKLLSDSTSGSIILDEIENQGLTQTPKKEEDGKKEQPNKKSKLKPEVDIDLPIDSTYRRRSTRGHPDETKLELLPETSYKSKIADIKSKNKRVGDTLSGEKLDSEITNTENLEVLPEKRNKRTKPAVETKIDEVVTPSKSIKQLKTPVDIKTIDPVVSPKKVAKAAESEEVVLQDKRGKRVKATNEAKLEGEALDIKTIDPIVSPKKVAKAAESEEILLQDKRDKRGKIINETKLEAEVVDIKTIDQISPKKVAKSANQAESDENLLQVKRGKRGKATNVAKLEAEAVDIETIEPILSPKKVAKTANQADLEEIVLQDKRGKRGKATDEAKLEAKAVDIKTIDIIVSPKKVSKSANQAESEEILLQYKRGKRGKTTEEEKLDAEAVDIKTIGSIESPKKVVKAANQTESEETVFQDKRGKRGKTGDEAKLEVEAVDIKLIDPIVYSRKAKSANQTESEELLFQGKRAKKTKSINEAKLEAEAVDMKTVNPIVSPKKGAKAANQVESEEFLFQGKRGKKAKAANEAKLEAEAIDITTKEPIVLPKKDAIQPESEEIWQDKRSKKAKATDQAKCETGAADIMTVDQIVSSKKVAKAFNQPKSEEILLQDKRGKKSKATDETKIEAETAELMTIDPILSSKKLAKSSNQPESEEILQDRRGKRAKATDEARFEAEAADIKTIDPIVFPKKVAKTSNQAELEEISLQDRRSKRSKATDEAKFEAEVVDIKTIDPIVSPKKVSKASNQAESDEVWLQDRRSKRGKVTDEAKLAAELSAKSNKNIKSIDEFKNKLDVSTEKSKPRKSLEDTKLDTVGSPKSSKQAKAIDEAKKRDSPEKAKQLIKRTKTIDEPKIEADFPKISKQSKTSDESKLPTKSDISEKPQMKSDHVEKLLMKPDTFEKNPVTDDIKPAVDSRRRVVLPEKGKKQKKTFEETLKEIEILPLIKPIIDTKKKDTTPDKRIKFSKMEVKVETQVKTYKQGKDLSETKSETEKPTPRRRETRWSDDIKKDVDKIQPRSSKQEKITEECKVEETVKQKIDSTQKRKRNSTSGDDTRKEGCSKDSSKHPKYSKKDADSKEQGKDFSEAEYSTEKSSMLKMETCKLETINVPEKCSLGNIEEGGKMENKNVPVKDTADTTKQIMDKIDIETIIFGDTRKNEANNKQEDNQTSIIHENISESIVLQKKGTAVANPEIDLLLEKIHENVECVKDVGKLEITNQEVIGESLFKSDVVSQQSKLLDYILEVAPEQKKIIDSSTIDMTKTVKIHDTKVTKDSTISDAKYDVSTLVPFDSAETAPIQDIKSVLIDQISSKIEDTKSAVNDPKPITDIKSNINKISFPIIESKSDVEKILKDNKIVDESNLEVSLVGESNWRPIQISETKPELEIFSVQSGVKQDAVPIKKIELKFKRKASRSRCHKEFESIEEVTPKKFKMGSELEVSKLKSQLNAKLNIIDSKTNKLKNIAFEEKEGVKSKQLSNLAKVPVKPSPQIPNFQKFIKKKYDPLKLKARIEKIAAGTDNSESQIINKSTPIDQIEKTKMMQGDALHLEKKQTENESSVPLFDHINHMMHEMHSEKIETTTEEPMEKSDLKSPSKSDFSVDKTPSPSDHKKHISPQKSPRRLSLSSQEICFGVATNKVEITVNEDICQSTIESELKDVDNSQKNITKPGLELPKEIMEISSSGFTDNNVIDIAGDITTTSEKPEAFSNTLIDANIKSKVCSTKQELEPTTSFDIHKSSSTEVFKTLSSLEKPTSDTIPSVPVASSLHITKEHPEVNVDKYVKVVSDTDLADGQVEIASVPIIEGGRIEPMTIANFSVDFTGNDDYMKEITEIKEKKNEEKNKIEMEMAILTDTNFDQRVVQEQQEGTTSKKLLEILTDVRKDSPVPEPETQTVTQQLKISNPKFEIEKSRSRFIKQAVPGSSKSTRPIILSEKIIKPPVKEYAVSVHKRPYYEDIEDIDAFIIRKPSKKLIVPEEEPVLQMLPRNLKKMQNLTKPKSKATILGHHIIRPSGEVIQPKISARPSISNQDTAPTQTQQSDEFDIDSMPIVLSDQLLTAETIENMPMIIEDSEKMPSSKVTTQIKKTPQTPQQMKLLNKTISPAMVAESFKTLIPGKTYIKNVKTTQKLFQASPPTVKHSPSILGQPNKPGKFIIVPTETHTPPSNRFTVGKRHIIKKSSPAILAGSKIKSPSLIQQEPTGNKIMIVTNNQGHQSRVLLTPAQQKMMGYQTPKKIVKEIAKPPTANIISQTIINSKGQITTTTNTNYTASGSSTNLSQVVKRQNIEPLKNKVVGQRTFLHQIKNTSGQPRTILIKNPQGQTVKRIQGCDDALLEQQVAEQIKAINKAANSKAQITYTPGKIVTPKRTFQKKINLPEPPKITVQSHTKTPIQNKAQMILNTGVPSTTKAHIPPLTPISPLKKVEKPASSLINKPVMKLHKPPPVTPPTAVVSEGSTTEAAVDSTEQKRAPYQLVIQDALGNQTTITEGQILALPSETLDGQPQSYMLVTLDESGNLTPLNNEALMSLDPNLNLGGDLSNMVLQIDQGASTSETEAKVPETISIQQPSASLLEVPTVKEVSEVSAVTEEKNQVKEVEQKVLIQDTMSIANPELTVPELVTQELAKESKDGNEEPTTMQAVACSINNGETNQQLIITGDPVATQKFLESLTEGNADLANLLANAEGNILIHADGNQILINTDSEANQMLLSSTSDNVNLMENNSNPIFSSPTPKNQDILAAALADTDVFQQDPSIVPSSSKVSLSQLSPGFYPMSSNAVLETNTMISPIMSTLEMPSTNIKKIEDQDEILAQVVPKNVDLPITITDPTIAHNVAQQQVALLAASDLHANLELPLSVQDVAVTSAEMNSPTYGYSLPTLEDTVDLNPKIFTSSISMPLLTEEPEDVNVMVSSSSVVKVSDTLPNEIIEKQDDKIMDESSSLSFEKDSRSNERVEENMTTPLKESYPSSSLSNQISSSSTEPPSDMFDFQLDGYGASSSDEKNVVTTTNEQAAYIPDHINNLEKSDDTFGKTENLLFNTNAITPDVNSPSMSTDDSCEIPVQPEIVTESSEIVLETTSDCAKRSFEDDLEHDNKKCKFD